MFDHSIPTDTSPTKPKTRSNWDGPKSEVPDPSDLDSSSERLKEDQDDSTNNGERSSTGATRTSLPAKPGLAEPTLSG